MADLDSKKFFQFCNSLRCVVCGSQLDGKLHSSSANLYCVNSYQEYSCHYLPGPILLQEHIELRFSEESEYSYKIISRLLSSEDNTYSTTIYRIYNLYNTRYKEAEKIEIFSCTGNRFLNLLNYKNEKVFLNKIKLYNVFS